MDAVTGAFSYTGKYITRLLLAQGRTVITLTGHPGRPNEFGEQVKALPYDFDHPERLVKSLAGVDTLYNTYWVRFDHGTTTFAGAVRNTQILFQAAKQAGVRRIVHTSITNPALNSPLPYFRGKAQLEADLQESGDVLRYPETDRAVRPGGHPDQQHRLPGAKVSSSSPSPAMGNTACSRSSWKITPAWLCSWARGG